MDPATTQFLFFGVVILALVGLMFRNGRKRQRDQQALSDGLKPGAEIMTTFGLFGTVRSIDDENNRIVIETGPGSTATIHRQAIGKVVAPVDAPADTESDTLAERSGTVLNGDPVHTDDATPQFGQRADTTDTADKRDAQ